MKKIVALLLALVMILSLSTVAFAAKKDRSLIEDVVKYQFNTAKKVGDGIYGAASAAWRYAADQVEHVLNAPTIGGAFDAVADNVKQDVDAVVGSVVAGHDFVVKSVVEGAKDYDKAVDEAAAKIAGYATLPARVLIGQAKKVVDAADAANAKVAAVDLSVNKHKVYSKIDDEIFDAAEAILGKVETQIMNAINNIYPATPLDLPAAPTTAHYAEPVEPQLEDFMANITYGYDEGDAMKDYDLAHKAWIIAHNAWIANEEKIASETNLYNAEMVKYNEQMAINEKNAKATEALGLLTKVPAEFLDAIENHIAKDVAENVDDFGDGIDKAKDDVCAKIDVELGKLQDELIKMNQKNNQAGKQIKAAISYVWGLTVDVPQ